MADAKPRFFMVGGLGLRVGSGWREPGDFVVWVAAVNLDRWDEPAGDVLAR